MSLAGEEEPINMAHLEPDPLLRPGAFIDPTPSSNGNSEPIEPEPVSVTPGPTDPKGAPPPPPSDGSVTAIPDWLPPGWKIVERVRSSGASAGTRDKYYLDPESNRRFRSKKEVLYFLETGATPKNKKKNATSDADGTPKTEGPPPKKKKSELEIKDLAKNFNFDDVPTKVKWSLTDIYEGTWRPLVNGIDRVPESSKQTWAAAFTYLTLHNGKAFF